MSGVRIFQRLHLPILKPKCDFCPSLFCCCELYYLIIQGSNKFVILRQELPLNDFVFLIYYSILLSISFLAEQLFY